MPIKIKRKNGKVTRYKNAEYIPLFYFLPKSLLDHCGTLPFQISRYPYELITDEIIRLGSFLTHRLSG